MSSNYNYVDEIATLKLRVGLLERTLSEQVLKALDDEVPQPNTKDEWKVFATHWADGGWNTMQWYDDSVGGDNEWFDFEEDDAFYPFEEKLIIRFKGDVRFVDDGLSDEWV